MIAITAMVLVLGNSTRVETTAVGNRLSASRPTPPNSPEQWMLTVVEAEIATPGSTLDTQNQMQQRIIGNCAVWVISPDPDNPEKFRFGLTDEGAKIDLNTAGEDTLALLPPPPTTSPTPSSTGATPTPTKPIKRAEDTFYLSPENHPNIPVPYHAKNSDFETVEELRLVRGIDDTILYGRRPQPQRHRRRHRRRRRQRLLRFRHRQ